MANIDNPYMNGLSYLSTLFNPHNPYILHLQNVFNNLKQQQQQQQGSNDGTAVALDPAVMIQNLAANMGQIINPGVGVDGGKMSPREVSSADIDATDGEPKSSSAGGGDKEYVSKMKTSRHHHHHHHHHHHNHGKSSAHRRTKINKNDLKLPTGTTTTTTNAPSSTSPSLSSVSSASSSPLSSSSSSSLISSEPGSPVLLSPQPPQQQQKSQHHQFSHPIEQHVNNAHPHLIQNMMLGSKHLQQSYSVPKLASTDASSQKNTSPYYHTGGGEHFFAPSKAGQTSSSAAASNEVKQKLKNLILQKLNKDNKLNQSTSNLPVPTSNNKVVKSSFSPKTESKIATPPASIRAPEQHHQQQQQQQQQQQHKPTSMGVEMDENLLRRTTSEPNLKVKSALKDRLLEKRNLVNPFVPPNSMAKRANISGTFSPRTAYQPMYESQVGASMQLPPPPPPPPPAPNASLSTSLGSLHSSYNNQDQNSIFAAAAAAAAAAVAAITNQQQAANQQQDQKQQQSAAIAAAAASLLTLSGQQSNPTGNNNNHQQQQQLASLLQELAFQQQLAKNMSGSFDHNNNNNNNNIMPDHKLSASVSFPTLPRPQQYGHPMLQPAGYSQYGGVGRSMHHPHHHHHGMLHPVTTKFGHIADVEEENELLLENELKCAAKLNDAASKNMYDEETHRNHHHQSWHKSEQHHRQHEQQEQLTPTRPNEDDNDEEGMMVESQQPSLPVHLGQHHPYHPKHQQQQQQQQAAHQSLKFNKFNRLNRLERANSSQYYAAPHGHAKAQVEALNNIELIQRQLAHLQQQQQQQQDEELKRQQRFATSSSTNRTSYFSDPYLLKSFEIASISSNGNLNAKDNQENNNKQLANYFKRGDDRLLGKSNQVSCSTNTKNVLQTFISNKHMTNKTSAVKSECDSSSSPHVHEKVYRYTTALVYDPAMLKHECTCLNSSNHLETSDRIESIWNRFKSLGLDQECELVQSKQASIHDLLTCHSEQYALIYGSDLETRARLPKEYLQMYMMNMCIAPCNGIALAQDQDNSWNEEHTPVACRTAVGSTYELASLVYNGKLKNGFALVRPPGSHAEHSRPFGFCYFNTVACVAKMLKKNLSLERILIVDWDVHHGNGTQQLTYNDGNILYISLHRHDGGNFFPGTGSIHECGEEAGLGKNVNIAWNSKLNPAMSDAEYLAAFRCVVMPIAKAFDPQIVLVSSGFDATEEHPKELGGYKVSPMCFAYMTKKLMSLADGKVVLVLEGGYDLKSLCDCSELCLHALMNKQTPSFADATLHAQPNTSAIADLENVIQIQKKHWPMLNDYKQYIRMSHNQFISVYTE